MVLEQRPNRQSGLSVLTITLLLALLGGTLAAGLTVLRSAVSEDIPDIKNDAMLEADDALMTYLAIRHYLPCPASDPEGTVEDCSLVKGWLPMKELHLTVEMFEPGVLPMRYVPDRDLLKMNQRRSLASWNAGNDNKVPDDESDGSASAETGAVDKSIKIKIKTTKQIPLVVDPKSTDARAMHAGENREWWDGLNWSQGGYAPVTGSQKWPALPDSLPDTDGDGWPDTLDAFPEENKPTLAWFKANFKQIPRTGLDMCEQISESVEKFSPKPALTFVNGEQIQLEPENDGKFTAPDTSRPYYVWKYDDENTKTVNIAYAIITSGAGDAEETSSGDSDALVPFDQHNKDNTPEVESPHREKADGYDDQVWVREHSELIQEVGCPSYFYQVTGNDKERSFHIIDDTTRWLDLLGKGVQWWEGESLAWLNDKFGEFENWDDTNLVENKGADKSVVSTYKAQGYDNLLVASLKSVAQAASVVESVQSEHEAVQVDAMTNIYFGTRQVANIALFDTAFLTDRLLTRIYEANYTALVLAAKFSLIAQTAVGVPRHPGDITVLGSAIPTHAVSAASFTPSIVMQVGALSTMTASVIQYSVIAGIMGANGDQLARLVQDICQPENEQDDQLAGSINGLRTDLEKQAQEAEINLQSARNIVDTTNRQILFCQQGYLPTADLYTPFLQDTEGNNPLYQSYYDAGKAKSELDVAISELERKINDNTVVRQQVEEFMAAYMEANSNKSQADLAAKQAQVTREFQTAWEQDKEQWVEERDRKRAELAELTNPGGSGTYDLANANKTSAENALAEQGNCPVGDAGRACRAAGCETVREQLLRFEGAESTHYVGFLAQLNAESQKQNAVALLETLGDLQIAPARPAACSGGVGTDATLNIMDRITARNLLFEANKRGVMK